MNRAIKIDSNMCSSVITEDHMISLRKCCVRGDCDGLYCAVTTIITIKEFVLQRHRAVCGPVHDHHHKANHIIHSTGMTGGLACQ